MIMSLKTIKYFSTIIVAVIAVLAGGVAVVSEIDANNRIAEAFSGTTEVVAATKTIHAGDEISASDLAFVSVPNSTVADGAITKKDIDNRDSDKYISVEDYNHKCRENVMKFTAEWRSLTEKMGYFVDLDHPYITYDNKYIETLWWLL